MPTRHVTITDTNPVDIIKPPKNRRIKITMLEMYNTGSADTLVTLTQVSPLNDYDGSQSKVVAVIPMPQGSSHIVNDSKIYEINRGWKLQAVLSASTTIELGITYELE